jgi:hypothetical protein
MDDQLKLQREIQEEINKIPIIDSHDHLGYDINGEIPEFDLCDLIFHNLNPDLTASGMPGIGTHAQTPWPKEAKDPSVKWKSIKKFLKNIENIASYKALLEGIKELHEFPYDSISDSNWQMLDEQVRDAYKKEDWTDFVLKKKCNIQAVVVDMDTVKMYRDYFFPAIKLDYVMMGALNPESREKLENRHKSRIKSFEDFQEFLHKIFEEYLQSGAVAIKSVAAYYRIIRYDSVSEQEAKAIFTASHNGVTPDQAKKFQDFTMHEIVKMVNERKMPIQFHTGKLAWNFQNITNTNPVHLTNLLQSYRSAKFDLFHGGLPYANEFGILANNYPNAYLDLNGLMWTSFSITKKYLNEWIEMVPQNKILWGADSFRVLEGVVGQVKYFKKILSEVLAEKVLSGYFDQESAIELAKKILYKNGLQFFNLKKLNIQ